MCYMVIIYYFDAQVNVIFYDITGGDTMARIIIIPHYEGNENFIALMKRVFSDEIRRNRKIQD